MAANNSRCDIWTNRQNNKDKKTKMGRKNNYMDTSSNKSERLHIKKTWTWLRKGNLKKETESLIIATQNNAIRTNYIEAKIDKTQ